MTYPHSPIADTTQSDRSNAREQISILDARIQALAEALANAKLERQDLQTRLDAYRYPILTLPTEITSAIFLCTLPPYPDCPNAIGSFSLHILAQVCPTWREISLSTPRLWRAIKLVILRNTRDRGVDLLSTWISRSKDCLLSVSLDAGMGQFNSDLTPFAEALMPHSARRERLEVPVRFLRLIGPDVAFPVLSCLILASSSYSYGAAADAIYPLTNAPILTDVTLGSGFNPSRIRLPWWQLTSIRVLGLAADDCISILQQCAALRELRCSVYSDPNMDTLLSPVAPLLHLRSLTLDDGYLNRELLGVLNTPALRHLSIPALGYNIVPIIDALLSRSNCALTSLHIIHTKWAKATWDAAFPSIPIITVSTGRA